MPFTADQPIWGNRVHSIGAGPRHLPVRKLSIENLTRSISEAVDDVRKRAQVIGQGIRGENGVKYVAELIKEHLSNWRSG